MSGNGKQNVIGNEIMEGLDPALQKFMFQQAALSRAMLSGRLGMQFGGNRDLYSSFGYIQEPNIGDYKNLYKRQGLATRAVEKFSNDTWNQPAVLIDGDSRSDSIEEDATQFVKDWVDLTERVRVWQVLRQADVMCGFGRYSLIFIGAPGQTYAEPAGNKLISYLAAYDEGQSEIVQYIRDTKSPEYGMPEFYNISFNNDGTMMDNPGGSKVHYSRAIHVAEDRMGSRVFGRPRLERIINRLFDLEKVTGGGAEAAWLAVFKGMLFLAKDGAQLPAKGSEGANYLDEQINKLMHRVQRYATLEDVEVHDLGVQEVNVRNIFDVLTDDLAGSLGIPKRILFGSERGELASSQDKVEWNGVINSRRTNFAEPDILRPFVRWCITHKVVAAPTSGRFQIEWADVYPMTKLDKAEYSLKLATGANSVTGGVPEMAYDVNEWRADNDLPPRTEEELAELEEKQEEKQDAAGGMEPEAEPGDEDEPAGKDNGRSPFMDRSDFEGEDEKEETRRQAGTFLRRQHKGPGDHPSGSPQSVHGKKGRKKQRTLWDRETMDSLTVELPDRFDEDVEIGGFDIDETWEKFQEESGSYYTSPAEFVNSAYNYEDEETGLKTKVTEVWVGEDEIKVVGNVKSPDGMNIGNFERVLTRHGEVIHEWFEIPDNFQGNGFGIRFYENSESVYIDNGIRAISLHANLTVGGYAWARVGFSWDGYETNAEFMTESFRDYFSNRYGSYENETWSDMDVLQPYHIASITGPEGERIGKEFLLDGNDGNSLDWHGVKYLTEGEDGFEIGESYYRAKGIK
jgi:uncharacterized protein